MSGNKPRGKQAEGYGRAFDSPLCLVICGGCVRRYIFLRVNGVDRSLPNVTVDMRKGHVDMPRHNRLTTDAL